MTDPEHTGIDHTDDVAHYVDQTYGTENSCMSADERATEVIAAVNQELTREGIPALQWHFGAGAGVLGLFDFQTWTMALDQAAFDMPAADFATPAQQADLVDTVYHEARHAEQWFRVARERAGLGETAEQLTHSMQIPQWVAERAAQVPIQQCDTAEIQAEQWDQSVYGSGAEHRDAVLSDTEHHYEEYRRLPEEADAWATGDAVTQEYLSRGR